MKRAPLLLLALAQTAFAQDGILGTKAGTPVTAATGGGGGSLIQTLLAVAVVAILLKWALPKLAKRLGAPLNAPLGAGLKIEESANFPGGHLHIVRARGKTLLLGTTSGSVALLADLTEPKTEDLPLFRDMVEGAEPYSPASADLARRLDHLGSLRSN